MLISLLRSPFGIAAFLLPLLALFKNNLITVLLIVLTVAVLVLARPQGWRAGKPVIVGLGLLLFWCLLSSLWSLDAAHSLARFGRLAPTVLAGVVVCAAAASIDDEQRRIVAFGLALGLVIACAIAVLGQIYIYLVGWAGPHSAVGSVLRWLRFRPFSSVAAMAVFPLAALAFERRFGWISSAAILAAAGVIFTIGSNAAMLSLIAGAVVFGLTVRFGTSFVRILSVALPLGFIGLPSVVTALNIPELQRTYGFTLGNSAAHRLAIWRFVGERIDEKPYLGWGLHTSRLMPGGGANALHDPHYRDITTLMTVKPDTNVQLLSLHPHSATLQLRLELGLPGMLLYATLYALIGLGLSRRYPPGPALAAGSAVLAAAFVTGQLSFSAWQSWWLSAQFCAAALFLASAPRDDPPPAAASAQARHGP